MNSSARNFSQPSLFLLHDRVDRRYLEEYLGQEFSLCDTEKESGPAFLLDTFDHDLRLSGCLLAQCREQLFLFTADPASILCQSCPGEWRFAADLPEGAVKKTLTAVSSLRAFLSLTSSTLRIVQLVLRGDEEKIHVKGSLYVFEEHNHTTTVGLLCPVRGYQKTHRMLMQALHDQRGVTLIPASDLYAELGCNEPIYQAKPDIALDPDAPICETVRLIMKTFFQVARHNEAGIKADYDTEFLHDYRVSLRKVRSVLSLCKKVCHPSGAVRLKQAVAAMMKPTNRLRDLDVYLLAKTHYFSLVPDSLHSGLSLMFSVFAEERQRQLAQVVSLLESASYTKMMSSLVEQLNSPHLFEADPPVLESTVSFARRLIWKRYKKVCNFARRMDADAPDDEIHALRIQCKKLRYAMEFFAPLFPKKAIKQRIKDLKQLQDNLGQFNDYAVQQRSLHAFLHDYSQHHANSVMLAGSVGALVAVLYQQQQVERRRIIDNFLRFDSAEIRTEFAALFAQEADI